MTIVQVTPTDVLKAAYTELNLNIASENISNNYIFLSAVLRKQAGYQCPCSAKALASTLQKNFKYIIEPGSEESFHNNIEKTIEMLIATGDLLELQDVATMDQNTKGTWLFAAPPAYIRHPTTDKIFLIGISPDEASPLPGSLNQRLKYANFIRYIVPEPGEQLIEILQSLGFMELSWSTWHKMPKKENPADYVNAFNRKLLEQTICRDIDELEIIDYAIPTRSYKKRWVSPTNQTGKYICRRPQLYGSSIWGYCELIDGALNRFLDFPTKGSRFRGCDDAWLLQLAIDFCQDKAQSYTKQLINNEVLFKFYSPLPMWVQRKYNVLGRAGSDSESLFSYYISLEESEQEENFLQSNLWLKCSN